MRVKHLSKKRKFSPRNRYFLNESQIAEGKHMVDVLNSQKKRGELQANSYVILCVCGCGCGLFPVCQEVLAPDSQELSLRKRWMELQP